MHCRDGSDACAHLLGIISQQSRLLAKPFDPSPSAMRHHAAAEAVFSPVVCGGRDHDACGQLLGPRDGQPMGSRWQPMGSEMGSDAQGMGSSPARGDSGGLSKRGTS